MAPIFATPDIAALVAAFPPSTPTRDSNSLVRSAPGGKLLDSRKVLAKFRLLLETSPSRINKADLPPRLGVVDSEWIFDSYNERLFYSRDGRSILPEAERRDICEQLDVRTKTGCVFSTEYGSEKDVSEESLDHILESLPNLLRFSRSGGSDLICSNDLIEETKENITSAVGQASVDKVDVTEAVSEFPVWLVSRLAGEVLSHSKLSGILEEDCEGVVYVPPGYQDSRQRFLKEAHVSRIQELAARLKVEGYCQIEITNSQSNSIEQARALATEVMARCESDHNIEDLVSWDSASPTPPATIIATRASISSTLQALKSRAIENTKTTWQTKEGGRIRLSDMDSLHEASALPQLGLRLLSSEYAKEVENVISEAFVDLEDGEKAHFATLLQNLVAKPAYLYTSGLDTISDSTLSSRLDDYLCMHFRTEILPDFTKKAREHGLLRNKSRAKDLDKMVEICAQPKSMTDVQSAVAKFCRKQKVETPSPEKLSEMKKSILQRKVKDMHSMTRGSDVLQNLVWVALARVDEGLFMSAGKDTSRMVKYFQSVGDAETGQKLEEWRDMLKAGKESNGEVQAMRAMAEDQVRAIQD